MLQTPLSISDAIWAACHDLSPHHKPIYINITPEAGLVANHCFPNIAKKVAHEGGEALFGWAVYLLPRLWIEFQSHTVWKSPSGTIFDPTPRHDGEKVVLFLQIDEEYPGQAKETQMVVLSDDARLAQAIEIQKAINRLWAENRPDYATPETKWLVKIDLINKLDAEKQRLFNELNYKIERNDPCPCMSRKKYKHCCGK
jgi:hypothetical protein